MWENRKLASWVVFFLLSAMHFNPYAETVLWKVWLLPPKKTKSSGRVENREREKKKNKKKKAATCKKKMSVQCLVSVIEGERRARNEPKEKEKKRCSSPVESFWLVLARFPPKKKRRAEAKPLSPALCMTACCCATGPHTLFTRVSSASSLFYTFDILRAGGGGRWVPREPDAAVWLLLPVQCWERCVWGERGSKTSFKISFYSW